MYPAIIMSAILLNVVIIAANALYIIPLRRAFRKLEERHASSVIANILFVTVVNRVVGGDVLDEKDGSIIITNRDLFEQLLKQYEKKNTEIHSTESD